MLKYSAKNNITILIIINILLFSFCVVNIECYAATVDGAKANIAKTIVSTTEPESTHPKGFKVENAQYYDYVGYDDQGRLVDKNNIIIGKGEGGSGQGGANKGNGQNNNDSNGTSGNGTFSNKKKQQELNEEKSRQESIEARISNKSLLDKIREENEKQNRIGPTVIPVQESHIMKEKPIYETEKVEYETDFETVRPTKLSNGFQDKIQTQPKASIRNDIGPTVVEESIDDTEYTESETTENDDIIDNTQEKIQEEMQENTQKETQKQTQNETQLETEEEIQEESDVGEKEHNDDEAEYKEEFGNNNDDGKGDGYGKKQSGVKIFELDRKGNIGIKQKPGINNLYNLIFGATVIFLLLLGIFYYYVPYIFKTKKQKKCRYI